MNIFAVHKNPAVAAIMLCDKHVSKMTLETAQMLSTVARSYGYGDSIIYKTVHPKHPCTLWQEKVTGIGNGYVYMVLPWGVSLRKDLIIPIKVQR